MEKIIVGIDFSKGSDCALDLAIDLANKWGNQLKMVYVLSTKYDSALMSDQEINNKIDEVIKRHESKLHTGKLECIIRHGRVYRELNAVAEEENAWLIVVGSHGTSGYERNWIGKNAYRTITEATLPVLTIRENFNFNKALEKIVLPLDSSMETRQKVTHAIKFAKAFNSEVYVLGLYSSGVADVRNIVDKYVEQTEKVLVASGIKCSVSKMETENVTQTTLEFAEQISADLIMIMAEQETTMSNILLGSYAQQMIHHSQTPVLTIHSTDLHGAAR
ncbi:MAG: universal stress protein [Bacteroidales bacterium]|nr:universal stress protein [Bacteroidales bacterium]